MERLALLAVTAHPGDELAMAGTLAWHAEAGVHVALACATRGGEEAEHGLRCACSRLGVAELHLLGFGTSGPRGEAAGAPGTLSSARACDVVRQIVGLIRRVRPQVMITFGPDGIDGHVDHVATGGLASQAFGAAPDLQQFPLDGGPEPYGPAKLYHFGLPEGLLKLAGIAAPGTPDAAIAAREDVSQFVDLKVDAARCYGAAMEPRFARLFQLPPVERRYLLGVEFLSLAQPQPAVDDRRDPHLFAGIP